MSKGEFGEPWEKTKGAGHADILMTSQGVIVCETYSHKSARLDERAVACVNALTGRDPAAIQQRLEERDELLAACNLALHDDDRCPGRGGLDNETIEVLAAAIAKAEGGKDVSKP